MSKIKKYFNIPQLRSIEIAAPNEFCVAGRGTGKTTGILAPKSAQHYFGTMPRGTHVIINATFTQAYTRTLKELIRGWQSIGYIFDHHFIVGRRPTDKWIKQWNWKGPYAPPLEYKHFVCWYNGAVGQLISQDRPGSSNGISIDSIIGDEVKLLNYEKLTTELFPANRGIIPEFRNNPYHHGITMTTDMPVATSARWILDYAVKMDKEKINYLFELIAVKYKLKQQIKKLRGYERKKKEITLSMILEEMNEIRHGLLYYHEASTLDNIHALGIEYIEQQLRDTSIFQFETQILNLRPLRLENGFYPDFDEEYHGYFAEDSNYFDRSHIDYLNPVFDCRKDCDINSSLPLHISLDYNRRINPLEVAQVYPDEIKHINAMQVLFPLKLKDVMKEFIQYYKPHQASNKIIYYWYDHTATGAQHDTRLCDDVIEPLSKAGWIVIPMYIGNSGQTATHEARFRMWGKLLTEDGNYSRKFRTNRENCNKCILSIQQAGAEAKGKGYGKNKKPEHDPNVPADEATHHSEALDLLVWGVLESGLDYSMANIGGSQIIFKH